MFLKSVSWKETGNKMRGFDGFVVIAMSIYTCQKKSNGFFCFPFQDHPDVKSKSGKNDSMRYPINRLPQDFFSNNLFGPLYPKRHDIQKGA